MSYPTDSGKHSERKIVTQTSRISLAKAPCLRGRLMRSRRQKAAHFGVARVACRRFGRERRFAPHRSLSSQVFILNRVLGIRRAGQAHHVGKHGRLTRGVLGLWDRGSNRFAQ
jgi:hypothetical protein